jgi:hypothetical protein
MTQPALEGVTTARAQEIRTGSPRRSPAPLDPGALRLDRLPDPAEAADLARHWKPYRSLASSLLLATHADCLRPSRWRSEGPRP